MNRVGMSTRIEFANALRGIAALIVLFWHYVLVFNSLNGAFPPFPSLGHEPFPWVGVVFTAIPFLSPGPVGVSIFFLVSGLVIPNSVAALAFHPRGRLAFVTGRLLRIWPTYAAGLLVSILSIRAAFHLSGHVFVPEYDAIAANITLFRDWLGYRQFDGVVWTLEVEAKFYLFVLLFFGAIARGHRYPLALIALAAIAAAPLKSTYDMTLAGITPANFLFGLPFLLFMCIGIAFNYHTRRLLTDGKAAALVVLLFVIFAGVAFRQGLHYSIVTSYAFSLALYAALYVWGPSWSGGPIVKFFAAISFPLYASHAMFGYVGLSAMLRAGMHPIVALIAQVSASILLATALHFALEKPTHRSGKTLSRMVIASAPLAGQSPAPDATPLRVARLPRVDL
jgi:peptidoglycan/LPS O-acetylase OafA/YrhL